MKQRIYCITGATGHLGGTLVRMLQKWGAQVRALALPGEPTQDGPLVTYYHGDVRKPVTLRPFFQGLEDREVYLIHAAGLVDIGGSESAALYAVNVQGTRNIIALCREYGVKRLVYVSSVHAIPEKQPFEVMAEVSDFDPAWVVGGYAKSKAAATQAVLEAARAGLDAVVVQPSGIIGPFDEAGNHLVQLVRDYMAGKLPACVKGGYDFVDVRDVAYGCLKAAEKGRAGECYILSNRHYEVKDVLRIVRRLCGGRRIPTLPLWVAQAAAPLMGFVARCKHVRPLYTRYSLYTLRSNDRFSHDKATATLGYRPRDLTHTLADTVAWLRGKKAVVAV